MTSFHLFMRRLKNNFEYQWKVLHSVFDWTVLLYIVFPAVIIFLFIYRSWWIEIPNWIEGLPFEVLFFLLYVFIWNGQYRSLIKEGDKIFLIKKKALFYRVKVWGLFYSILFESGKVTIVFFVLMPLLKNYYLFSVGDMIVLFIFLLNLKFFILTIKFQVRKIELKVIKYGTVGSLFFLFHWLSQLFLNTVGKEYFLLLSICVGVIGLWGYFLSMKKLSSFQVLLEIETEQKLKFVQMIFYMSNELAKPIVITRKKPLLFRNSKRIFSIRSAKNGFSELFLKVFLRNRMNIATYFQIISITTAGLIILPPIWMKILLFLLFLLIMPIWIDQLWNQIILFHPFMKKYVETDSYFLAKRQSITILYMFSIFFVVILFSGGLVLYKFIMPV